MTNPNPTPRVITIQGGYQGLLHIVAELNQLVNVTAAEHFQDHGQLRKDFITQSPELLAEQALTLGAEILAKLHLLRQLDLDPVRDCMLPVLNRKADSLGYALRFELPKDSS